MNRTPNPWLVVLSQWLVMPIVAPIVILIIRNDVVWPQWLAFLINANYDSAHYRDDDVARS